MLDRPILGKLPAPLFVLRVITEIPANTLKGFEQLLKIEVKGVRDHTRGLFEAEASIFISAAHPLENVAILFA